MAYYDVIVIGLGAHGSATLYELSKAGVSVLGIDRYRPPHHHGSSHGQSRIIRQAYHEHPLYVPFVQEAYVMWQQLEENTARKLMLKTGGMILGKDQCAMVEGAGKSAELHGLPYEVLKAAEIRKYFPAFKVSEATVGVWDKTAGILYPEECIRTMLDEAERAGARALYNERVLRISEGPKLKVVTEKNTYEAEKLVISAGAWLNELMPELRLPLRIERQVLHWFRNRRVGVQLGPQQLPVYIWEYQKGRSFYGFPDLGDGLKTAFHYGGRTISPDALTNDVSEEEIQEMQEVLETYLDIEPVHNYSATCMYTDTPDENFIIDFHPGNKNIIVASPCSGHGFKFATIIGKILSDLAIGSEVMFDLSPFRISRF